MSKNYVDYMVEETKNILAIDSPSGYTKEVADYVMGEYKKLGYEVCSYQSAAGTKRTPFF